MSYKKSNLTYVSPATLISQWDNREGGREEAAYNMYILVYAVQGYIFWILSNFSCIHSIRGVIFRYAWGSGMPVAGCRLLVALRQVFKIVKLQCTMYFFLSWHYVPSKLVFLVIIGVKVKGHTGYLLVYVFGGIYILNFLQLSLYNNILLKI